MRALVTGATGFIGYHVAKLLHEKGYSVRALVRPESDTTLLKSHCELIVGDVRDADSVARAMKNCRYVYHVAADYRYWVPDASTMYATNVTGTINVMKSALHAAGLLKVIYTSSAGVLSSGSKVIPSNENNTASLHDMVNLYKKTKFLAEEAVFTFIEKGLPAVIVNPTTTLGAVDRKPTPSGQIIVDFLNGRIPAYIETGINIVDVEDVAVGHLMAADYGRIGERYILGNANITLKKFFECLAGCTKQKAPNIRLPYAPVVIAAYVDEAISKWVTHKQPRISLPSVKMAKKYMYFDSRKAVRELQMPQTPLEITIEKAIRWYENNGYVVAHPKCDVCSA